MPRKKHSKGFCTQKYLWKKPKVTSSTDETIPALSNETIPALLDETIPALSDEIKPARSDETIPALSGLSNDSCSGNSPTCSNVYVQTCEVHSDFKRNLFVHIKPVPRSHVIWTDLPLLFDRVSVIMELCRRLAVNSFCSLQLQEVINMNKLYVLDLTVFILF
ncbi:hypothetical protein DPMN_173746 [Dreissena polymorpha]|uniref:Uncharacterized protein n=1 Tax=Dreissena polymorpha TaxID=45954 RepID=A0A9D4E412_DREPO|nr:hypothetical protein DPMN_173746 [Dreissena polymorpha]